MKKRFLSLLLVIALVSMTMTGCRMGEAMQSMRKTAASSANLVLTPEEAKQIALTHAGLTEDLVVGLHAQYEMEHGTPIYDVEFHHSAWEYGYEIHANTGEILSFSKDK